MDALQDMGAPRKRLVAVRALGQVRAHGAAWNHHRRACVTMAPV